MIIFCGEDLNQFNQKWSLFYLPIIQLKYNSKYHDFVPNRSGIIIYFSCENISFRYLLALLPVMLLNTLEKCAVSVYPMSSHILLMLRL